MIVTFNNQLRLAYSNIKPYIIGSVAFQRFEYTASKPKIVWVNTILRLITTFTIFALFSLALPLTAIASTQLTKPQRIVSLSLCTDQLLLMLVEPERIQALSFLAVDPTYSYMHAYTKGIQVHHGLSEEIVPLKPDLIVSSQFTRGKTPDILKTLGFNLQRFSSPITIEEVEVVIKAFGETVGEPKRAQQLIKAFQQDLITAKQLLQDTPRQVAISYGPNGFTAGAKTLKQAILDLAGYDNLAAQLGINYYGNISVEKLLMANSDVIIVDEMIPNQNSLVQNYVNHRALIHHYHGKKRPTVVSNLWLCPGPTAGKAVLSLIQQRLGLSSAVINSSHLNQVTHTMPLAPPSLSAP